MRPVSFGLPKSCRLRKRPEFLTTQKRGRKLITKSFLFFALPVEREGMRLGVTVSRKVGVAVVRNRVKRLLREAFRLHQHELPSGLDLVAIARSEAATPPDSLAEVERELLEVRRRLGSSGRDRRGGAP